MNVYQDTLPSPIGNLLIKSTDTSLSSVSLVEKMEPLSPNSHPIISQTKFQLEAYFNGERTEFDLPYDLEGHPPFYQKVWQALLNIPYGQTTSYSDLAISLGDVKAVRAVGTANGKNPIAICIPCHRVIGKNRKMVGYAWGIDRKKWLLSHELSHTPKPAHLLF